MSPKLLRMVLVLAVAIAITIMAHGQTESASLTGTVKDTTNAIIINAEVILQSIERGTSMTARTNAEGIYVFPSVRPGQYRLSVKKQGFQTVDVLGITANVQDHLQQNIQMSVGSADQSVTVTASSYTVDTQDGTVSTVVDRNFAENMPLNGRSFQALIQQTPGVVLTANNGFESGQFSVNGQRADSNYWSVDGVSANIGVSATTVPAGGSSGSIGAFSAQGGTNSLVSVDAMQEFRIQTSTYAPEFGRTPGGQISIVTRSGTNAFHGSLFDYIRNDVLDAANWFNGFDHEPPLPKAKERQNDFGGTVGGPIIRNKSFFFFSYEGLRLRLPQTGITQVPDLASRQSATSGMKPYLDAFPQPNGPERPDLGVGIAEFDDTYSNSSTLDAASLRLDERLGDRLTVFGRYNYAPSDFVQRSQSFASLNTLIPAKISTQTGTLGAVGTFSPHLIDDFRFNYSRTDAKSHYGNDDFGGATPLTAVSLPSGITSDRALFFLDIFSLTGGGILQGIGVHNDQRQLNIVNSVSWQVGGHQLKFGADYRRLWPTTDPGSYTQQAYFSDVPSAAAGNAAFTVLGSSRAITLLFRNLGLFAQDTWNLTRKLTLTYGLRWDIDFSPKSLNGPALVAVSGYNPNDLSGLALLPSGTQPFATDYKAIAPRVGLAYQLHQGNKSAVIRGGFGVFYDLATEQVGSSLTATGYPLGSQVFGSGGSFPLSQDSIAGPPIDPPPAGTGQIISFNPDLRAPYTMEWNASFEQALGAQQSITLSYVGAAGRRLLQTIVANNPNATIARAFLITNGATSDYDALQVQFNRHLTRGLQALSSYTWSHSIDTASGGSSFDTSNILLPGAAAGTNRASSSFDIRHTFSAGITYEPEVHIQNRVLRMMAHGWSFASLFQARTAPPVNVIDANAPDFVGFHADSRPDLVPGKTLYLHGAQYPGGLAFNADAFQSVCTSEPCNGSLPRQGTTPRNFLRGFGAWQWDLGLHRTFPIYESLSLQFRVEAFNLFNHPNFGQPSGSFGLGGFGLSNAMLGESLAGNSAASGGFASIYQIGGPRSLQMALRLSF